MHNQTPTPHNNLTQPSGLVTDCQNLIHETDAFITEYEQKITQFETKYRTLGLAYHRTRLAARNPALYLTPTMSILHAAFEISTEEQYNTLFKPMTEFSNILNQARDVVRPNGHPDELHRRAHQGLDLQDAMVRHLHRYHHDFGLEEMGYALQRVETENILSGLNRYPWDLVGALKTIDAIDLLKHYEEWGLFRAWVGCLPETNRAVECGRSLDVIALELLKRCPERETFEGWCYELPTDPSEY